MSSGATRRLRHAAIVAAARCVDFRPGFADPRNAAAVIAAINEAVSVARDGIAAAIVTAPIQKASLMQAGFGFPGHTEYLRHLTGARRAVMMLAGGGLRVVPLTIHVPAGRCAGTDRQRRHRRNG